MSSFGLTPQGFQTMRQADILAALQAAFQAQVGNTINLAPESLYGQICGIMSEREALIWEKLEDAVLGMTPAGAEGVGVDNLLAYRGHQRLGAKATVTNPTPSTASDGKTLYGLVLTGTPGTLIKQGSLVQTQTQPALSFALDADVTIGQAANALQRLFFSGTPTQGSYTLLLQVPSGATVACTPIAHHAQPQASLVAFAGAPSRGSYVLSVGATGTVPLPYNASAQAVQDALQALPGYATAGVTGTPATGYTITWPTGPVPFLTTNSTRIAFAAPPTAGAYTLALGGSSAQPLPYTATAAEVQAALRALPGYSQLGVTGSSAAGFTLHWGPVTPAAVTFAANSTGQALTAAATSSLDAPLAVTNSAQAALNAVVDPATGLRPFTDLAVTAPTPGQLALAFGAHAPAQDQPASGGRPQAAITVGQNSLQADTTLINLAVSNAVQGHPPQAVASATCTATGPNAVQANTLTVIGSAQTGWATVTNPLDAITGRDVESDTQAIQRSNGLLAAQGNGTLAAVVQKVQQVAGVTAALGFANTTGAALQRLVFATVPQSGQFRLALGSSSTGPLAYNASAGTVQAALAGLSGLAPVQVTGSYSYGYTVDFNGAHGGQAQPLLSIVQDTTGAQLAAFYGRPPKSIELVVEGGDDTALAETILATAAGGIATYGAPVLQTTGSASAGSTQLPLASVANVAVGQAIVGQGLRPGSVVLGLTGNVVTLSQPALSSSSQAAMTINNTVFLRDSAGNPTQVGFSRPQAVLMYVQVALVTDLYVTPGDPTSGSNGAAQFNPASAAQVQADLIAIGNAVPIGGLIVARGTQGLVGAFNEVPGVVDYTLTFDVVPGSNNATNIRMQAEQVPLFSSFTTVVSYT